MKRKEAKEIWRPLDGFNGLYEVSSLGNIRSIDHQVKCNKGVRSIKGKVLKPCDRGNGYPFVTCGKDGRQYNISVHRAVAIAFIPNPNNLPEINHKDCNTRNASAANLEWCDRIYNNNYNDRPQRAAKKRWKMVEQIKDGEVVQTWESLSVIGTTLGYSIENISACCTGKRAKANGFQWRYKEVPQ